MQLLAAGPVLSARKDATSILTLSALLEGESPALYEWICDVRDVARGHILAIEVSASRHDTLPAASVSHYLGS